MTAQIVSPQAGFRAANTSHRLSLRLPRLPARWVGRWFAVCAMLAFAAPSAFAQGYQWTNYVGMPGNIGGADGTGNAAGFNQPTGMAVDGSGNVYVADTSNHTIRKVTPDGVVSTLAGQAGSSGSSDGTGDAARFNSPTGVALDASGNIYVADQNNHIIRKVSPGGSVSTLAGLAGTSGNRDGTGSAAWFNSPTGVAVDHGGNIYVADQMNHTIRKVTPGGVVTTLAGSVFFWGSSDGTGSAAQFYQPSGVAVDGSGNVYVADTGNSTIRKVTSAGVVSTMAGQAWSTGSSDGTGWTAHFFNPSGVAVDDGGNVYVADTRNSTMRKVTPTGVVTTLAGQAGSSGSSDGTGRAALFSSPTGVAMDGSGNVYVADANNGTIRKVTPGGVVSTLAGQAYYWGSSDGTGSDAQFYNPSGVAVDSSGNVYVADQWNHTIRMVTPAGVVSTLAGLAGSSGSSDGTGNAARFNNPSGVAVDSIGNVYVADYYNHTIRKVTPGGVVTTLAGQAGNAGNSDGTGSAAQFFQPAGVAVDSSGNVYVADQWNGTLRKVTPAGVVTTLAGQAGFPGSSDGTGSSAHFGGPSGVAVDASGNVYVADPSNNNIRMVTPAGVVTTIGGTAGLAGGADGIGAAAGFRGPSGIAVSSTGTVFVADQGNNRISMGVVVLPPVAVTAAASSITSTSATLNGTVNGNALSTAVFFDYGLTSAYDTNVLATPATMAGSSATAVSAVLTGLSPGTTYHFRVNGMNKGGTANGIDLTFTTASGPPSQFAWTNFVGMPGGPGNADGTGSAARFNNPNGVAADGSGNVYVADQWNHTLRKVTPAGVVSTLAGLAGTPGSSDGTGSAARFYYPSSVAVDGSGNVYVADSFNQTIRKVTPGGVVTTLAGLAGSYGYSDGTGSAALFSQPIDVAVDGSGNVYVVEKYNYTLRKVTPAGVVSTLAGVAGSQGSNDGTGSAARFGITSGVAVDASGNVYVSDLLNSNIRKVTPAGVVTTLAGDSHTQGSSDGTGSAAQFWYPAGVAVDGSGNVYVADQSNQTIRKVTPGGVVTTVAGLASNSGSSDGTGNTARFYGPSDVAVDGSGNVYVADHYNHTIRKVTPGGVVTTVAGLASNSGSSDGTGSAARFSAPFGVAVDGSGNVYVADTVNNTIRTVTPGGVVSTLAGLAGYWGSSDGMGSAAQFNNPQGVAVDGSGNVYVADAVNNTIRKVTPGGGVTTLAGGMNGRTGSATHFNYPASVAVDSSGNAYVADCYNHAIRKVTPGGVVSTLAGLVGNPGSSDGTGSAALFDQPTGVAVDGRGNVYVADQNSHTLRKVTSGGVVTTLAGLAGTPGSNDGTGSAARFNAPFGVAVDGSGNVYVADTGNSTIRKVTPGGVVTTIGGTAGVASGMNGVGTAALFGTPTGIAVSSSGTLYVADAGNNRVSVGVFAPAPSSYTAAAGAISGTGATLNGMVNANGLSTMVTFDYGPTPAYGTTVSATPSAVTGGSDTNVSAVISGLSPGTTYHFRVNGTNTGDTTHGSDQTFTTSAATPTSWREQWYGTMGNSGNAADNADPYHTGVPNLVVFALFGPNRNPAQVAASQLPQPQMVGGNFEYSFTEPAGVSNVTYGAQYTTSLSPANWQPVTDTGTGTQHIFSVPIGSNSQMFLRLTLTNLNP